MSTRLILTRGLPGCGKTTLVRAWVAAYPARRMRLNRDDFRLMTYGPGWHQRDGVEREHAEECVTLAQQAAAVALLNNGWDVAFDDTNLNPDALLRNTLIWHTVEIWDMTDVPPSVCLANDKRRVGTDAFVGGDVIGSMWRRYIDGRPRPLPLPDGVDRQRLTVRTAPYGD